RLPPAFLSRGSTAGRPMPGGPPAPTSAMITDPLFFLLAVVAVVLLGLSKGGFFGLGVMALPLMSLQVAPMQAAAILLPTVLAQDALTGRTYRRGCGSSHPYEL